MRTASVLVFAMLLSCASAAFAQSTGGSFGGGSFDRPDPSPSTDSNDSWGGSSSDSDSWGSSDFGSSDSDSDWGSDDSGSASGSGEGGDSCLAAFCCLLTLGGLVVVVIVLRKKGSGGGGPASPGGGGSAAPYTGPNAMHVSRLSLGVDWRARKALQETLARLASSGNTGTPQGLANLLRETVLALRRAELSWLYISSETIGPVSQQNAQARFQQLATSARAAFQHELVRAAGGEAALTQAAPEQRVHENEGEGTVVVHLIVAAYRALPALQSTDANEIRGALDNRAALTADQLGALEVVWSPAAENDRMSTAELEQHYPDMRLIDPNSIAGRIFCSYCRGPFAMELLSCPHCGAPAEPSKDNRAPR